MFPAAGVYENLVFNGALFGSLGTGGPVFAGNGPYWWSRLHLDSAQDKNNYGNPAAGHTGEEIKPSNIAFTPVIFY